MKFCLKNFNMRMVLPFNFYCVYSDFFQFNKLSQVIINVNLEFSYNPMQPCFYGVKDNALCQSSLKCVLSLLSFVPEAMVAFSTIHHLSIGMGKG